MYCILTVYCNIHIYAYISSKILYVEGSSSVGGSGCKTGFAGASPAQGLG